MEHLIVGVLLFTPLLGLLPTTIVFYIFFTVLHIGTVAVRALLLFICDALDASPLFYLLLRFFWPTLCPGMLHALTSVTAPDHQSEPLVELLQFVFIMQSLMLLAVNNHLACFDNRIF